MVVVVIILVVVVLLGGGALALARWSGADLGLSWWGRPTRARVLRLEPLAGARFEGTGDHNMTRTTQRARVHLEVLPDDDAPYAATTIGWDPPLGRIVGHETTVRVSRTRRTRVHVTVDRERS